MEAKYCSALIKTDNQGGLSDLRNLNGDAHSKKYSSKLESFPSGIDIDKSMDIEDTHHGYPECNSPRSILDANSHFSLSATSSSSSEGLDGSESSSISEEDMPYFRELLSFALESPPSQKKSPPKYSAPVHNQNAYAMFSPSRKSRPSDYIYNCLYPFTDREIALPPYPAMISLRKNAVNRPPPTRIPAFQASHRCSDQFTQYPCPCQLSAAMEKHLGYDFNTKPPVFPNFSQPSHTPAPPLHPYDNRNNTSGRPFYNVGNLPILDPVHHMPPLPVLNRGSAPLPSNIPFNGGLYGSQHLHYNFRNGEVNAGDSDSIGVFESELQELLRGRRKPIRISSLPTMYEEKFHKPFNKSREKVTSLLSKCSNIVLVYRQGGQHVIMLKHRECAEAVRVSRRSNKSLDPRSRKVYLTFPPGSTFTSDDAEAYFRQFGAVRGVRMSHEEPATYAFVEFYTSEGALSALCSTRAHYISAQKVMVKPYRQSFAYKDSDSSRHMPN